MIDQELTVEIVVEMYEEKILLLKKEIEKHQDNYDELDY